jgi:hypothetical protein
MRPTANKVNYYWKQKSLIQTLKQFFIIIKGEIEYFQNLNHIHLLSASICFFFCSFFRYLFYVNHLTIYWETYVHFNNFFNQQVVTLQVHNVTVKSNQLFFFNTLFCAKMYQNYIYRDRRLIHCGHTLRKVIYWRRWTTVSLMQPPPKNTFGWFHANWLLSVNT